MLLLHSIGLSCYIWPDFLFLVLWRAYRIFLETQIKMKIIFEICVMPGKFANCSVLGITHI